ncbi:MAG TPA: hypothetical protein PK431_00715 [Chitinophagales bacterium]|nr:hypothetical protein [Chitinophagales bacterium]
MKVFIVFLLLLLTTTAKADDGIDKYWVIGKAYYKSELLKNQHLQLKVRGLNNQTFTFNDTLITVKTDSSGFFRLPYYFILPCDVAKYKDLDIKNPTYFNSIMDIWNSGMFNVYSEICYQGNCQKLINESKIYFKRRLKETDLYF